MPGGVFPERSAVVKLAFLAGEGPQKAAVDGGEKSVGHGDYSLVAALC